ncbi:intermembrane phospholipid transport protein YdbH family protein [Oceanimonas smirnovii]|uniref:YdbH domain-containing protein n=1 Tax=Oceanimonas smirnovii TaxID=264574 RepID=A0ABW7P085_9GAMM
MMKWLLPVLLLSLPAAAALPAGIELTAQMERAVVPACPKERAHSLRLHWHNGKVTGTLAYLGLDLGCSRSGNTGAQGEGDALSVLLTLPPVDFAIDQLTLHLPGRTLNGPARLRHHNGDIMIDWQAEGSPLAIVLTPDQGGWRWRGILPGSLLLPALKQPVSMQGSWQPGQGLRLNAEAGLPAPLSGRLQLDAQLHTGEDGWFWDPGSRLHINRLNWQHLQLDELMLQPAAALPLGGIGRWELSWQGGRWQQQALPRAQLALQLNSYEHGSAELILSPQLQVKANWRWQQGLALELPEQRLSLAAGLAWLNRWLALPDVVVEQGQLVLALQSANVLSAAQPLILLARLEDGRLSRGELSATGVSGQLAGRWQQGRLRLNAGSGLTIEALSTGVPVTNIHAALSWRNNRPWLSGLTANVLEGRLALSPMPLSAHLQGELHIQDVSLASLLNLTTVSGLTGDGRLHGRLPFVFDGAVSVHNGRLWSHNGWVSYQAGEALRDSAADNMSLALTLGMLEDLRYQRLSADMTMAVDGEAVIMTRLQGRAPVGERMHPVNFNYRHQENLLQLLQSLRFAEDLSERLPAQWQGGKEQ